MLAFQIVSFYTAVAAFVAARSPISAAYQQPLPHVETMSENKATPKVPGNNDAIFGPIPKDSQLFEVEFLEIAPSPIPTDRVFFLYLRGEIPPLSNFGLEENNYLQKASLNISLSAVLDDGETEPVRTYTIPLRSASFGDAAHFSIRNAEGAYVDTLSQGRNDLLVDCSLPGMFIRPGMWTFDVEGVLEDNSCLFSMSLSQRLDNTEVGKDWGGFLRQRP